MKLTTVKDENAEQEKGTDQVTEAGKKAGCHFFTDRISQLTAQLQEDRNGSVAKHSAGD